MKTILSILFLFICAFAHAQYHNVEGIRVVGRSDSTTISNVGQIQFDADDDKFRFNDGTGWFSFLKEGATLPYWPLAGTGTLTGATNIDTDGNNLTIGDPTFAGEYFAIESTIGAVFGSSQSTFFHANSTGLGITLSGSAEGDIYYNTQSGGINYLAPLAAAASGNVLLSGTAPSWGKVGLTSHVSGVLPTANGGTGLSSFTTDRLLYTTSSSAIGQLAVGNLLSVSGDELEFGGTATGTTTLEGASQALNFGTSGSAFGTTQFNLGPTTFNAGTTTFNFSGSASIFTSTNSFSIGGAGFSSSSSFTGPKAGSLFSGSGTFSTGNEQGSILEATAVNYHSGLDTSNGSVLRVTGGTTESASIDQDMRLIWLAPVTSSGINLPFSYNGGSGNWYGIAVEPRFSTTGTYSGTARGFYYNPDLNSTVGLTNIAIETTSGSTILHNADGAWTFGAGSATLEIGEYTTTFNSNGTSFGVDSSGEPDFFFTNLDATTGGMKVELRTAGSGDSYFLFNVASGGTLGSAEWAIGVDNSDGDALVISAGGAIGTGNVIKFTTGGDILTPDLPTNCTGKATGTWWNDSGTLKLCP